MPGRAVDQLRPCDDPRPSLPSFCLALPAPGALADPAALVARRQDACAQLATGEAPGFCVAPPAGSASTRLLQREVALVLLRQRLGPDFRHTGGGAVDLWTETSVATAVADRIHAALLEDAAVVERRIGRPFGDPPAVFLFASRRSFSDALVREFGFIPAVAALASRETGGVTIAGLDAVAINGESVLAGTRPTIFRHELTHVAVHRLAGAGVPAWLDEGLAALAEAPDPSGAERASALSLLSRSPSALSAFAAGQDWMAVNAALEGHGYGIAAEGVRVLQERIGEAGIPELLERIGGGLPAAAAIAAALGEPLDAFIQSVPDRATAGCPRGILVSGARPDGLRVWRAYGFLPHAALRVTIDGPGHYAYGGTADATGVFAGTVGGPMPDGTYVLRVTAETAEGAAIAFAVGDASAAPLRGCVAP